MSDERSNKTLWCAGWYSFYSLISKVVQPTTATLAIVGITLLIVDSVWSNFGQEPDPKLMMAGLVAILFAMSVAQSLLREEAYNLGKLKENDAGYFALESIGDLIEIFLMIAVLYNLGLLKQLIGSSSLCWPRFYLFFGGWLLLSLFGELIRNRIIQGKCFPDGNDKEFAILRGLASIAAFIGVFLIESWPQAVLVFALLYWVLMIWYFKLLVRRTDYVIKVIIEEPSGVVTKNQLVKAVGKQLNVLIEEPENAISLDKVNQAIDTKIRQLTDNPKNAVTETKVKVICKSQIDEAGAS